MRTVDEILEHVKRLSSKERQELLDRLADTVESEAKNGRAEKPATGRYARTLAAIGIGHTEFPEVSSNKGKHLAEAYAPKRRNK
jgi:hypothetical protein